MGVIPFGVDSIFDDVDDIYWAHEILLTYVLNVHALMKKTVKTKQTPFMKSKLRKAAFKKAMLFSKYVLLNIVIPV